MTELNQNFRILIIGSDATQQDIFKSALLEPYYQLDFVSNDKETLGKIQTAKNEQNPYSLTFIDIQKSSAFDDIDIIPLMIQEDSATEIVICSYFLSHPQSEILEKLGSSDSYIFLNKPFTPAEIQQITKSLTKKWALKKQAQNHETEIARAVEAKGLENQTQIVHLEELVVEKIIKIKNSEERYTLAAKSASDGLWDWDLLSGKVYFSERFAEILRVKDMTAFQTMQNWYDFLHPEDKDILPQLIQDHLEGRSERVEVECRLHTKLGQDIWVYIRGLAAYDSHKVPVRIVGFMTDISDRKAHDLALYQAAFHDELTGLANRALFMNRLEQIIARERRLGEMHAAIMFLDLDRFKSINDTLGHQIGDEVLKIVAMVLKNHTRPTDTICRIGGDEFTVLLDPVDSLAEAEMIANRILKQLNRAYDINEKEVYIGSSIGLTLIDDPNVDAQIFLRNADLAMYQAKTSGKSSIEIFDQQKHRLLLDHMEIENDLRNAVKNDELLVYYQPIIDLRTGHVTSFESLMRWRHPQKGFVSPAKFIPLAEELGLIGQIGLFTVESVCKQLRLWQAETVNCPSISVNVSVRQLMDKTMFEQLYQVLADMKELSCFISVEVTESVIMKDPQLIIGRLNQLRTLNMKVYIDDFGTGYSSLSYLASFPLDYIKIDQAFIASMLTDSKSERLVASIIRLAAELGHKTVAEGVETEEQMQKLIELSCDFGQGHYFAKAMNAQVAREIVYNNTRFNIGPTQRVA